MVVNILVMYESCSNDVSGFTAQFEPAYRQWRAQYRDALSRYDSNARARRYVACGLEHERRRMAAESPAGKAQKANLCTQMMGPGLERFTR